MSSQETEVQSSTEETTSSISLLDQAVSATRQTEPNDAKDLIKNLMEQAMKGTVTWDKNLTVTVNKAISAIDSAISKQLAAILHDEKFQKLEGSWRGLSHLVYNTETGSQQKIRVLNITKKELSKDLAKAVEFDQSQIFKKVYESEFGIAGGMPYGVLLGDYEIDNHPDDLDMLTEMSHVAAAGFCPFIAASGPSMFGFDNFTELSNPRDLERIFDSAEYIKWRSFRDSEDSRFVSLVMPRTLARLPYGSSTKPIEAFHFEELPLNPDGSAKMTENEDYTWMNACYSMGTILTQAFAENGWCTSIRGAENGGKVMNLPTHTFKSDDGSLHQQCPTEIGITDRREAELSKLGFLPLCHYKNTDYAVFFGSQTTQRPKTFDDPDASSNASISARLPYILATGRIAHYLKVMGRDKIGSFMTPEDTENWLNRWIMQYVESSPSATAAQKARYPLADAKIEVKEIPGQPGSYSAVAWLQPWLQMEELTTSLRLVANIPKGG